MAVATESRLPPYTPPLADRPASPHACHCSHSCGPRQPLPAYVKPLELVIEVAFVIFAAMKAPIALAISLGVGIAYQVALIVLGVDIPQNSGNSVSCGQSNGEQYMGRGLLPYEVVIITAVYFFDHIRHEPKFYVPILGFYVGTRIVWTLYTWNSKSDKPEVNNVVADPNRDLRPRQHLTLIKIVVINGTLAGFPFCRNDTTCYRHGNLVWSDDKSFYCRRLWATFA